MGRLELVLLVFALVGYLGAGASFAVARYRKLSEGDSDIGMLGVAVMLLIFGGICTLIGVGFSGVFAFGGVIAWVSYILMAQHIGMFTIETGGPPPAEETTEEPRRAK